VDVLVMLTLGAQKSRRLLAQVVEPPLEQP